MSGLFLALVTCVGLFAGGAYWHNAALRSSFRAGEASGEAKLEEQMRETWARQSAAAEAALADARVKAAAMDSRHERMQEALDALEQTVSARRDASHACLAAGVVRQLDALGRNSGSPDRRP